jgi:hypothetical protein
MALSTNDQNIIRDYLLGRLADDEQQKIEERLMVEDDFFDEFESSKDELVEQYCAGELGKKERVWFENHYLASTEGRQRYELALTLEAVKLPVYSHPPMPQPALFERITSFFKRQPWAMASATSAVLVVIVAGVWLSRSQGPTITGPTLTSKLTNREGGDLPPPRVQLPSDAGALKLRLLLPRPSKPGVRYRADLDNKTEQQHVEVVTSDAESVSVEIRASLIPSGEYGLILIAINPDGTEDQIPGQYLFNID